jgi:hypothetical protein
MGHPREVLDVADELSRLGARVRAAARVLSRCRSAFEEAGLADTFAARTAVARVALTLKELAAALGDWSGI